VTHESWRIPSDPVRGFTSITLAGLAACGFQSPGTGPSGNSDIDASIMAMEPDAPRDPDDPDFDDDGVLNAADNCPDVANMDQFNEDRDVRGDACDPCPQLSAEAADVDTDADKVGDGCDPHPDVVGDKLVYWNGFHVPGAALPTELSMVHGSGQRWTIAGDHLVFTRSGDDWNIPAFETGAVNHTTDATFEITATYNSIGAAAAGVAADIASNDDDVFECQARTDSPRREMWYWNGRGPGGVWTELDTSTTPTPNGIYRIVLRRNPADMACTTTRDGSTVALATTRPSALRTRAGLFARNVDVRYQYLAIYTSP
jgi:hypothetical protein